MIESSVEIEAAEKFEIEVRKVKAKCPKCKGELEYTGTIFYTSPPEYQHRCKECGNTLNLYGKYPNYITIDADLSHKT